MSEKPKVQLVDKKEIEYFCWKCGKKISYKKVSSQGGLCDEHFLWWSKNYVGSY